MTKKGYSTVIVASVWVGRSKRRLLAKAVLAHVTVTVTVTLILAVIVAVTATATVTLKM